jgi:hypothetical protein
MAVKRRRLRRIGKLLPDLGEKAASAAVIEVFMPSFPGPAEESDALHSVDLTALRLRNSFG